MEKALAANVMVFSHPNHEIAVLGTIARLKPCIVFLTDGGGEDRMAQSRQGLSSYVKPENLHFLRHSEASFYDALVGHDVALLSSVAEQVRDVIVDMNAEAAYCDAVEFYNPVHDIALPIVRAALRGLDDLPVYEVPLVHQRASDGGYELQRAPSALDSQSIWSDLTDEEHASKVSTLRGGIYQSLFGQMGDMILAEVPQRAQREQFILGRRTLPEPAPGQRLRYEERGRALQSSGDVRDVITYRDHYAPMFESLCPPAA